MCLEVLTEQPQMKCSSKFHMPVLREIGIVQVLNFIKMSQTGIIDYLGETYNVTLL